MVPLVVDPGALFAAGAAVVAAGDGLVANLTVFTAGFAANTGHDVAGTVFGLAYQDAAESLLKAVAAAINTCRRSGALIQQGASNYSKAEAASTLGGGAGVLQAPGDPATISVPGPPGTLGPGQPPPLLWAVVESFVDDGWPDGDVAGIHAAAARWRSFAGAASGMRGALNAAKSLLDAHQIPEGGKIDEALSQIGDCIAKIGEASGKLATTLDDFADEVDQAQNDIRDLLHRLGSLADLGHDVMLIIKGDAIDEIKKIAKDINGVLHDLGREARAAEQGIKLGMQVVDGLLVKMEKYMRRELTDFLGEAVGNQVATAFDFFVNANEGVLKGAVGMALSMGDLDPQWFLIDPQGAAAAWTGMAKGMAKASLINGFINPQEAGKAYWEQLKSLLHLDDWSTARPGLGFGENVFDGAMFFVPGAGEAGGAAEAGGVAARGVEAAADAAGTVERVGGRAAGELGGLAGARGELADIAGTGGDLTTSLESVAGNLPKIDPPLGGRPVDLPAPKPLDAPVEPAPHPPDTAPGAPSGPTPAPSPTPPEPAGAAGGGADDPVPAPAGGGPHDPVGAPAAGAHDPLSVPAGGRHEPASLPAATGEQMRPASPQLAEPTPVPTPVSPVESPVDPAPAAAHSPQPAAPIASASPHAAPSHLTPPAGPSAEPPTPHPGGPHSPGRGGPPGGQTHLPAPHGGDPHGPNGGSPSKLHASERPARDGTPSGDNDQPLQSEEPPVKEFEESDGAGETRHTISGHGDYSPAHGYMKVPRGTTITVYAEHGSIISDALGNLIETGGDTSGVYSETFLAGEPIPDYTIYPPDGLDIMGAPQTVAYPTHLSELINEDMGPVDLAVCTYGASCPTGKAYDVDGIFDEWTGTFQAYERYGS